MAIDAVQTGRQKQENNLILESEPDVTGEAVKGSS